MTFLKQIFDRLQNCADVPVVRELRDGQAIDVTGRELLQRIARARAFLASQKLRKGDRCALLAPNSIDWIAVDLAIMAEGLIVVPLYARQATPELVAMMKDCSPALICCGDATLRDAVVQNWPIPPLQCLLSDVLGAPAIGKGAAELAGPDPVTIIYTSGTSGEAKGVVLTADNVGYMLACTSKRLDVLMQGGRGQDRVYHYLPLCFAGSWISMLTGLRRGSLLVMNTDLMKIATEMGPVAPDYFLNVPALLERMRKAVDEQFAKKGGLLLTIYQHAKTAAEHIREGKATRTHRFWAWLAATLVFPTVRKKMVGPRLKALICGSAPLNVETQLYFMMLGIRVLQVYGLTETTAICTMDDPQNVTPGRVGPAIEGIEMGLAENDEVVVRGPNIFAKYWAREAETAKVLQDGWFHTGDQGEVDASGNWRIIGRLKNLIILGSGHNIAPEPIEDKLLQNLPGAQQAVLAGNGRGYLAVIVTGNVTEAQVQAALDTVNPGLPHYKQVRAFHIRQGPFSIENGLLTANGKLKRDLIAATMKNEIESMYEAKPVV